MKNNERENLGIEDVAGVISNYDNISYGGLLDIFKTQLPRKGLFSRLQNSDEGIRFCGDLSVLFFAHNSGIIKSHINIGNAKPAKFHPNGFACFYFGLSNYIADDFGIVYSPTGDFSVIVNPDVSIGDLDNRVSAIVQAREMRDETLKKYSESEMQKIIGFYEGLK